MRLELDHHYLAAVTPDRAARSWPTSTDWSVGEDRLLLAGRRRSSRTEMLEPDDWIRLEAAGLSP